MTRRPQIDAITDKLEALLWSPRVAGLPPLARQAVKGLRFAYAVVRDALAGNLPMRAMGLVYVTILSIVPLIAISFSVLKGFGVHRQLEPVLVRLLEPLGDKGAEITRQVMGFVDNLQGDVLAGVGLVMLFLTTLSMAQKVEDSFNFVWRVEQSRNLARRLSEYLSVILLGPVVMVTALALIAGVRNTALVRSLESLEGAGTGLLLAGRLGPYLLVILGFSFVYWFLPNTRVRVSAALVGGLAGGVLWATAGVLFTAFVAGSARTLTIYATFAIVVIALIWLYVCWLILLVGAQVAFYFQHPEQLRLGYRPLQIGNRQREQLALSVMALVAEAFTSEQPQPRLGEVAAQLQVPGIMLSPTVRRLEAAGLLARTEQDQLLPLRDLRDLSLAAVLAAVRDPQDTDIFPEGRWPASVQQLSAELETASRGTLAGRSVLDLAGRRPAGPAA